MLVEVCVSSIEDVFTVKKAKADRVELCSVMEVIGVTPSLGSFLYAKENIDLPIVVMIRPRAGGYNYSDHEFETMKKDIEIFKKFKASAFVFGILTENDEIDINRCQELINLIGKDKEVVFHKAFDHVSDKKAGIKTLIKLGFTRVLTAGGLGGSLDNIEELKELIKNYGDKIEIMPGGGITVDNVETLLEHLDLDQIHLSAKYHKFDQVDYIATDFDHLSRFVKKVKLQ